MLKKGMTKTLVLIDGHSLAYRMHFALEHTHMATSKKEPTWAIYGFFNALFSLLKQVKPDAIALSFDVGRETFRNELYPEYKAHRESMPDGLKAQMQKIMDGVACLGIPIYKLPGYEADDVIGTLSRQAAEEGVRVQILTGDQDSFQLVEDGKVEVLIPGRSPREGLKTYDSKAVFEKLGVTPLQVPDFKGLKGDTSDNIPGVPGIGDKTAAKLLSDHPTLEALYERLGELPPNKLREKLETHRDQAFLSKKLAIIDRHAPIRINIEDCHLVIPDMKALIDFLDSCEFRTFIQQAPDLLAPFLGSAQAVEIPKPVSQTASGQMMLGDLVASEGGNSTAVLTKTPTQTLSEPLSDSRAEAMQLADVLATWTIPYELVTQEAQLTALVETLHKTGIFALDLETTGLDVVDAKIVGIALSVCDQLEPFQWPAVNLLHLKNYPHTFSALKLSNTNTEACYQTWYIPVAHQDPDTPQLPLSRVLEALKPLLTSETVVKVVHNAKYELNVFKEAGIPLQGLLFDTMLASYVQNPDRRHGLKGLAHDLLHHRMQEITTLIGTGKKSITFDQVPVQEGAAYAACDARATLELAVYFLKTLQENPLGESLWTLFYEIENPLARVLAEIERAGVSLDTAYLATLSQELTGKLDIIEADIYRLAGCEFNLNSPKQVGEVLFEKLQITPLRKTPSKSGYSTDAKVLELLAGDHEVVQKLLDYRQLFKLKSTYIDNLPDLIHPRTHRIHTSFNQTVTATGRLSSSNPNLQNIPNRSEIGRLIRQAFVPAQKTGWKLISADYSQIELRLLAHFSADPNLVEAFSSGVDVHSATAALVFGVPIEAVTKDQRYRAKTVNFGVIYGQSAHGLSQQLKISRAEAQQFIDLYFMRYHRVKEYIETVKAEAHETGLARTLCGRIRDLSEGLNSTVRSVREFSERAAFNTPLQGTAADLMKVAMIRVSDHLHRENFESKMILQVHDEVVLEVPEAEVEAVSTLVVQAMELDQPLLVPLVVDVHVGASWMET